MSYNFLDLRTSNEPYFDEMVEAAARVIRSGRYVGGRECELFESELAAMTGSEYCVGVSNGLDALRLIFKAYIELGQLSPGDEVIVPANTYIASVLAVSDAGLTPVLVEPSEKSMNLDTSLIEAAVTPRTRAVLVVHLYGRVCFDATLVEVSRRHNLLIVEDVAQAIGALSFTKGLHGGDRAGALGHAGAFSFYPTKNIGAVGDAGAVTTSDPVLAGAVRALANYGSDRRYHNIYQGYNCRLDPIQAAMLRVKLPHTADENADRFARALAYYRTIDHPQIIKPEMSEGVVDNVWHQYVVRVTGGYRDKMQAELAARGVATDIHYAVPPHRQPCYSGSFGDIQLPVTERLASEVLSLPIARGTSVKDAADISRIINQITLR